MPSNRELIDRAGALGADLGIEVVTEGLKNDALTKLVADLEAQAEAKAKADADAEAARERAEQAARESEAKTQAEAKAKADADAEAARERAEQAAREAQARRTLKVAPKRSVTSQRGILGPGTEVSERDFHGGAKALDALLAAGVVVRS